MITKEAQNLSTCVYVVEGDEFGGYRACGTVFVWQSDKPVAIGDDVCIEGPSSEVASSGKVLSVFKVLANDAKHMLKAFSSVEEMIVVGYAIP